MTEEKYGYEEIRKVLFMGLAFGEAVAQAREETSFAQKAAGFLNCVDEAIEVFTIDRELLVKEWEDFDKDERKELSIEAMEAFDLEDDDLEHKIEESFQGGLLILEGIERTRAAWKGKAQE